MSGATRRVTIDKAALAEKLELSTSSLGVDQTTSQWLNAAAYRSCFCIAFGSVEADWTIEALLPSGQVVEITTYLGLDLFNPESPKYISMSAMCGLPIRFVSSVSQPTGDFWVVLKS
jgi:hypothetical protein